MIMRTATNAGQRIYKNYRFISAYRQLLHQKGRQSLQVGCMESGLLANWDYLTVNATRIYHHYRHVYCNTAAIYLAFSWQYSLYKNATNKYISSRHQLYYQQFHKLAENGVWLLLSRNCFAVLATDNTTDVIYSTDNTSWQKWTLAFSYKQHYRQRTGLNNSLVTQDGYDGVWPLTNRNWDGLTINATNNAKTGWKVNVTKENPARIKAGWN